MLIDSSKRKSEIKEKNKEFSSLVKYSDLIHFCKICQRKFYNENFLFDHLEQHKKNLKCTGHKGCKFQCKTIEELSMHIKKCTFATQVYIILFYIFANNKAKIYSNINFNKYISDIGENNDFNSGKPDFMSSPELLHKMCV